MSRRIFREAALRRHNERLDRVELPRYATLSWARLWLACGLLLAVCGGLLWAADVPVYAAGSGFITGAGPRDGDLMVIALFPPELAPRLTVGQPARVGLSGLDGVTQDIGGTVMAVEGQLLSPAAARARFASLAPMPNGPVVVVHATLDAAALGRTDASGDLWRGSRADVRVAVGTQSGLALLPGFDRMLAEER